MTISKAKDFIRIPELWNMLGLSGSPSKSCHAPWREDKSASFSIFDDGRQWHDFATGDGGDAVDFLRKAQGLDAKAACREIIRLAQNGAPEPPSVRVASKSRMKVTFNPPLWKGSISELESLSQLRGLSIAGLQLAQDAGILLFSRLRGESAWVVGDGTGRNRQARRLDGGKWPHIGDKKAWTLPGSQAAWPLGVLESLPYQKLFLCEGGPDFLSAFHFIVSTHRPDSFPIAMLGAGLRIHADALPHLTGKRIRIFPHVDENGQGLNAATVWQNQLESVGATVDAFSFEGLTTKDGGPVKDLNDLARMKPGDIGLSDLWEGL
jgi:CHC2-type zinc finger protein